MGCVANKRIINNKKIGNIIIGSKTNPENPYDDKIKIIKIKK